LFKINLNNSKLEYSVFDIPINESLMYITIIKMNNRIMIYRKYFKEMDILQSSFNDLFTNIQTKTSKLNFVNNSLKDEIVKLKTLNVTQSKIGTIL
jgi:hypothetical protein